MEIDEDRFEIRLAAGPDEIASAQRLRYRVFVEEMKAPAAEADHVRRLERDRFDPVFDHLVLIDRTARDADPLDRVKGVYRLLPGERAAAGPGYYGASEYDLGPLIAQRRRAVELGRSCVDQAYRGGAALHLLWRGLARYVLEREIEILFGVGSFHGTDPAPITDALAFLHHEHLAPPGLRVRARPPGRLDMNLKTACGVDRGAALRQIPQLIKSYLRVGGVVGDGAYIDHDFNTIDVCLLMDTARMVERYKLLYTAGAQAA